MGKAFLAGQSVCRKVVTGQITGNDTTTLEITDINTQPRFIFISSISISSGSPAEQNIHKFIWFNDADGTNWLNGANNVYGFGGWSISSTGICAVSSYPNRSQTTQYVGYYDSTNKKIVFQSTVSTMKFLSTKTYVYLIGY